MGKLIFGKNGQVHFNSENEKQEAIEYLLTSDNVDFDVHEDNQEQGAWGPEERIHFKSEIILLYNDREKYNIPLIESKD